MEAREVRGIGKTIRHDVGWGRTLTLTVVLIGAESLSNLATYRHTGLRSAVQTASTTLASLDRA
jgi:hypothetical protein